MVAESNTSFYIEGELIDLTYLHSLIYLICDGKLVHDAINVFSRIRNEYDLACMGKRTVSDEKILEWKQEFIQKVTASLMVRSHSCAG